MKIFRLTVLIVIPFLFSCLPKKPEIPGTEAPVAPFVQALEQQRRSFAGLRAIARVEALQRGRKRSYDTVGIVLDGQRRLRIEAFGPLGQSVIALVWDGKEVLLRLPGDDHVVRPGQAGIERILGMSIEAKELCAVFSGTVPEAVPLPDARAYCLPDGACVIELHEGDVERRVHVLSSSPGPALTIVVVAQELYRSDKLTYRARYERKREIQHVPLPETIVIENPERDVTITVEYTETDVNAPLPEEAFTLGDEVRR